MSDETTGVGMTSWLPSLESLKGISWTVLAKWGALALAGVLLYGGWQNVSEWLKPAPAPVIVSADKIAIDALRLRVQDIETAAAPRAEMRAIEARVLALEEAKEKGKKKK